MKPFIDQTAVQPAPATDHVHCERRRPEETTLYQLVKENVETFFPQVEAETGASLLDFVKDEFEAFLDYHHDAYIAYEHFVKNQERLRGNATMRSVDQPGPAREGMALLPGLVWCGQARGTDS